MTSPRRNFLAGKARALPHKTLRPLALFGLFLLGLMFDRGLVCGGYRFAPKPVLVSV
jgi:hypothetical protein